MMLNKIVNEFKLKYSPESNICVKYSKVKETINNWGDALNPFLLRAVLNKNILHHSELYNTGIHKTLSFIGSILDYNYVKNLYVLGSGFRSFDSKIFVLPKKVYAIRGPKSKMRLKELGFNKSIPEIYGDPALLISDLYKPVIKKQFRLGIIPHYIDKNNELLKTAKNSNEINIIDIELSATQFIDEVLKCEYIASSSLHGLIASDAYQIPSTWLVFSRGIVGGDFKFLDYFNGIKIEKNKISVLDSLNIELIIKKSLFNEPKFQSKYFIDILNEF